MRCLMFENMYCIFVYHINRTGNENNITVDLKLIKIFFTDRIMRKIHYRAVFILGLL